MHTYFVKIILTPTAQINQTMRVVWQNYSLVQKPVRSFVFQCIPFPLVCAVGIVP